MPTYDLRRVFVYILTAVSWFSISRIALAYDDTTLQDRLVQAERITALDTADLKPWHLKAKVQLFDPDGKPAGDASLEEWWSSPETYRVEYRSSTYASSEINVRGKSYRSGISDLPPYYLDFVRRQIVHPVEIPKGKQRQAPELRYVNAANVKMDCITEYPGQGSAQSYCLANGSGALLLSRFSDYLVAARSSTGAFQGREVPTSLSVAFNGVLTARATIELLSTDASSEDRFHITPEFEEVSPPLVSSDELDGIPGKKLVPLSQPPPLYPVVARHNHMNGSALLRAIVDINGSIRKVEAVGATSPLFIESSIGAVKDWKYKPPTKDGRPVEVETVIEVNYIIGSP